LYAFLAKVSGVYHHWRQTSIAFGTSALFLAGAVPTNLIVAFLITRRAEKAELTRESWQSFQSDLHWFIALVVIVSAVLILANIVWKSRAQPPKRSDSHRNARKRGSRRTAAAVGLGSIIGGAIASTSVGGGVLIVPIFILGFGLAPVMAVGSSIFVALVLTLLSSLVYASHGQLDLSTALVMAIGAFVGVPLGAKLSKLLAGTSLQFFMGGIVFIAGIMMLLGGAGLNGRPCGMDCLFPAHPVQQTSGTRHQ